MTQGCRPLLYLIYALSILLLGIIGISCQSKAEKLQAKVAQDRASLRTLAVAIESYCMEWSRYPPQLANLTVKAVFDPPVPWKGGKLVSELGPFIPEIPFSASGENFYPRYFTIDGIFEGGVRTTWIVWMPGPDEDYDIVIGEELVAVLTSRWTEEKFTHWLTDRIYDPTNGTYEGDIIRWKQ